LRKDKEKDTLQNLNRRRKKKKKKGKKSGGGVVDWKKF